MTINEAIMKSELGMTYSDAEHDQIIEWLKELKAIRTWKADIMENFCKYDVNSFEELIANTRSKAIDDLTTELIKHISNVPNKRIGGGNVFVVADNLKSKTKL